MSAALVASPPPSGEVEAIRDFMDLFVVDGIDPPALTLDIDPNELANRYDALSRALSSAPATVEIERYAIQDLRAWGCKCHEPLLGWRHGQGPRCRICNAERPATADGWRTKAAVADQIIGQIEERFPNWRSFRDLIDCIDFTLADLRRADR